MKKLKTNLKNNGSNIEVEIISAEDAVKCDEEMEGGYYKVPASEKEKHQEYMAKCVANDKQSVDTEGLDGDRTYVACAIAYDQEYKTAYAPCVPGVGCVY